MSSISDKEKQSLPRVPVQPPASNPLILIEPCKVPNSTYTHPQGIAEQSAEAEAEEDDEYAAIIAQLALEIDNDKAAPPTIVKPNK